MSGGEPDLSRLLDEGGSEGELRALMRAGKSEMPNEAQMLALAAKLGALGGLGGASAAGAGGGGAGGGIAAGKAGLAAKVLAALAVIGVAGGGVAIARRKSVEALTPVGIIATSTSTSTSTNTGTRPSASTTPNTSTSSSVGTSPGTKTIASAFPSAKPAPTNAARPAESPDSEVRLLGRAQDALRGRPEEALALCNDHANRFPAGAFVQEREVIAIQALVETGREGEARARADRFEARFPHSTHTRRIETLLVTEIARWQKTSSALAGAGVDVSSQAKQLQLEFWNAVRVALQATGKFSSLQTPRPQQWFDIALGRSGIHMSLSVNTLDHQVGAKIVLMPERAERALELLLLEREAIEREVGAVLSWNPHGCRSSRGTIGS